MSAATITSTPRIGQAWPEQGGIYIGTRLVEGEERHVVIAGGIELDRTGQDFAAAQGAQFGEINGFSDWYAGDQEDVMLACINAREHFVCEGRDSIYWSRSEHHGWPWAVDFETGGCSLSYRRSTFRVRPFRSFSASSL